MAVAAIYQPVIAGRVFIASQQTGVTTSAGLSTDCKPLALYNPVGSGVNAIIRWAAWCESVAFAAASVVWLGINSNIAAAATTGTAATVRDAGIGGSGSPACSALITATLPATPVAGPVLGVGLTGAITTVPSLGPFYTYFNGDLVVRPGGTVSFQTSTASGASGFFSSICWEERPQSEDASYSG